MFTLKFKINKTKRLINQIKIKNNHINFYQVIRLTNRLTYTIKNTKIKN